MKFKEREFYGIKFYPGEFGRRIADIPWGVRSHSDVVTLSGERIHFAEDGKYFRSDKSPTLYEINCKRILRYLYS